MNLQIANLQIVNLQIVNLQIAKRQIAKRQIAKRQIVKRHIVTMVDGQRDLSACPRPRRDSGFRFDRTNCPSEIQRIGCLRSSQRMVYRAVNRSQYPT